jgi:hypothetical protein
MLKGRLTLFLMVLSAFGCADSQPIRLQLSPEARIGILNVLEPQMTHVDVGSLRFNSFTHSYDVDWDIPGYIQRTIENDLRARGHNTFNPLAVDAPEDRKQSMSAEIISAVNAWMPRDLKAFLEQSAQENRLDAIITVSSYSSGMWQENACFKIGKSEVATNGRAPCSKVSLADFPWGSGLQFLSPAVIQQVRPYVEQLGAEAARTGLRSAGLLP